MDVESIMTRTVFTCDMHDNVNHAAQLMWDHDCSCVLVVDEHHKLVGMLTQRDVAMAAYTQGKRLADIGVTVAMSHWVHAVREHTSIATAEHALRAFGVRRLPVVDAAGHPVGLITRAELARAQSRHDELPTLAARREAEHRKH